MNFVSGQASNLLQGGASSSLFGNPCTLSLSWFSLGLLLFCDPLYQLLLLDRWTWRFSVVLQSTVNSYHAQHLGEVSLQALLFVSRNQNTLSSNWNGNTIESRSKCVGVK